jgi:hypothetical protein
MFEYVVRKGGLKESEARWFFQQLIIGVDYLHRMVHPLESPAASADNTAVELRMLHSACPFCLLCITMRHHGPVPKIKRL